MYMYMYMYMITLTRKHANTDTTRIFFFGLTSSCTVLYMFNPLLMHSTSLNSSISLVYLINDLQIEEAVLLILLAAVERGLAPAGHQSAHGVHVGLGQPHTLLQVTHQVPCALDVLPPLCRYRSAVGGVNVIVYIYMLCTCF